jgi:hypothetical protein
MAEGSAAVDAVEVAWPGGEAPLPPDGDSSPGLPVEVAELRKQLSALQERVNAINTDVSSIKGLAAKK